MIDLVEGKKNIVGYVLGHKEPTDSTRRSRVRSRCSKTFIENENIKFQELNLFDVPAIPDDMKTIMIVGPQYDFSEREMKLLQRLLGQGWADFAARRSGRENAEADCFRQRARRERE